MDSSNLSPAQRTEHEVTISPREITATSDVPPPMSTTMLPVGSETGRPAPMAAAIGSSISSTLLAPAWRAASSTARRSTSVTPEGMQMMMWGLENALVRTAWRIKCLSMVAVMSKSAITPSFIGRTATMEPGVRPIISFACLPTASTVSVRTSTATTEGSRITMPLPFINTSVLAVPRSIPISFENIGYIPLSVSGVQNPQHFSHKTTLFIIPQKRLILNKKMQISAPAGPAGVYPSSFFNSARIWWILDRGSPTTL